MNLNELKLYMQKQAESRNSMLMLERHQYILETLQREGKVLASTLSRELVVSEDTIRRDLQKLAEAGKLQRVHGGALPRTPLMGSYSTRQKVASESKTALAKTALQLIKSQQVIIMDAGTTLLQVAHHLPHDLSATIITNSPPIAVALADHDRLEVILIGGTLLKAEQVTIGAVAVEALHQIRADLCLMGVCSLHPEIGLSVNSFEEAQVKRAIIISSAEVAALVSSSKLGTATNYTVAPLTELTHLVVESHVSDELLQPYQKSGITILK